MTNFRQTADASDLYRESTGDHYARIVSSTECGNFVDEAKNSTVLTKNIVAVPTTLVRSPPRLTSTLTWVD